MNPSPRAGQGTDPPEARPHGYGERVEEEEAIRGRAEDTAMIIIGMCSLVASIQYDILSL